MHRDPLLKLLENYSRNHPEETQIISRYREFVENNPDCFKRSLKTGHVTASAWLINPDGTEVLLTHHRKLNLWIQLGGHVDGNPDLTVEAIREAQEESGIETLVLVSEQLFDIDIHPIPAQGAEPAHFHYDARFLIRAGSRRFRVSRESRSLAWVPMNRLEGYNRESSVLRMICKQEKYFANKDVNSRRD